MTFKTLEDFAKAAGVSIVDCGEGWGGRIGYKTEDSPNCTFAGFRTTNAAYTAWAEGTFGKKATKALLKLLKGNQ